MHWSKMGVDSIMQAQFWITKTLHRIQRAVPALLVLFLAGILWSGSALAAQPPASAGGDSALVRQLLTDSGLEAAKTFMANTELPTEMFSDPLTLLYIVAPDGKINVIRQLYLGTFDAQEYFGAIEKRFQRGLHPGHAQKALEFFASPLGQKAVQMEVKFLNDYLWFLSRGKDFLGHYRDKTGTDQLPAGQRLYLANRMLKAMNLVDHDTKITQSVLSVAAPLNPYYQQGPSDDKSDEMKKELPEYIRTLRLLFIYRIYSELSDDNFKDLVKFYESSAGRWYQNLKNKGSLDAQDRMNQQARMRVASVLKAFEDGEGEKEILWEMFPPGVRQLFVRKRDPFQPLIYPGMDKKKKEVKEEVKIPVDRFAGKRNRLNPLPLEAYNLLKEMDPQLYQDLEFYGKLFQERTELEALSEDEFEEEVNRYESLLERATDVIAQGVTTPLQVNYANLRLVGVMTADNGTVALVQTGDSKGYTVKQGMLVGPAYGVVESINPERVEVVERERDYEGNVQTKVQYIAFATPEGSGEKK